MSAYHFPEIGLFPPAQANTILFVPSHVSLALYIHYSWPIQTFPARLNLILSESQSSAWINSPRSIWICRLDAPPSGIMTRTFFCCRIANMLSFLLSSSSIWQPQDGGIWLRPLALHHISFSLTMEFFSASLYVCICVRSRQKIEKGKISALYVFGGLELVMSLHISATWGETKQL